MWFFMSVVSVEVLYLLSSGGLGSGPGDAPEPTGEARAGPSVKNPVLL